MNDLINYIDWYVYRGKIVRWVDGDTVEISVDLGFRVYKVDRFRLLGVDTPERGREGFVESCQIVNKWAPEGSEVAIQSHKTGKYGRWLATIYLINSETSSINDKSINELLKEHGWIYSK